MSKLNKAIVHPSWQAIIDAALDNISPEYLAGLERSEQWLPGPDNIFAAFSQPLAETKYILMGESPYPRMGSANGYAFWDGLVDDLWSETGLSKRVNRATSLRNLVKMLLVARGDLQTTDTSQQAIADLDKGNYISKIDELFTKMMQQGILLLNASLVLSEKPVQYDAKIWRNFQACLFAQLRSIRPDLVLILFGRIAKDLQKYADIDSFEQIIAEHPYNISFVSNNHVLKFFKHFDLLSRTQA